MYQLLKLNDLSLVFKESGLIHLFVRKLRFLNGSYVSLHFLDLLIQLFGFLYLNLVASEINARLGLFHY